MLPKYKSAVESSELGKVSGPFVTEVGWVLLLVAEKRNKDITDEKNKYLQNLSYFKEKHKLNIKIGTINLNLKFILKFY